MGKSRKIALNQNFQKLQGTLWANQEQLQFSKIAMLPMGKSRKLLKN